MTIVRIADDALARAAGADRLAEAFAAEGHEIHRVSSWGMHWLEPLVEIDGVGWGPVTPDRVAEIAAGGADDLCIGPINAHPFIAGQTRLTFARAGKTRPLSLEDYAASDGWQGRARAADRPGGDRRGDHPFGPAGPRRRGLSRRHQVADRVQGRGRAQIHRLQRRRGR